MRQSQIINIFLGLVFYDGFYGNRKIYQPWWNRDGFNFIPIGVILNNSIRGAYPNNTLNGITKNIIHFKLHVLRIFKEIKLVLVRSKNTYSMSIAYPDNSLAVVIQPFFYCQNIIL